MRSVEKIPNVLLYFAGSDPYTKIIEQRHLPCARAEVQKLMASGKMFIHPSRLDALPRSVREAALMENRMIASNVGGIPEIVKDNYTGYLCDMNNPDEWIEQIHFLLNNHDVAKELGDNARRFVTKNFNWRELAEDFMRILKKKADQ